MEGRSWIPANPAPLGLAGFGITTLALSMVNAGLVNANDLPVVLGLAIAYGGLAQLLAGMWEFRTGNTFGAVAFTSYGAFWISFYFLVTNNLGDLVKSNTLPSAGGLYLWVWGIFTAYMFFCSFASARGVSVVFLLLAVTFIVLGIGWSGATTLQIAGATTTTIHIGGFIGLATAAAALYVSCAEVMFAQYGRWVLPIGSPAPKPPLATGDRA
jgi:succinate-acetate transporter protein